MTAPAPPLSEDDEIERELLRILRASSTGLPTVVTHDATLGSLGIDELAAVHLSYHLRQRFRFEAPLPPEARLGDVLGGIRDRAYWRYPSPPGRNAADLARGEFLMRFVRPPLHVVFRAALRAFFRFRVAGGAHVPKRGPFVLVANHSGHPDAPALMASVPLRRVNTVHPLAAADYFFTRPIVGGAVHALVNALPIDRKASAEAAMRDGLALLEDGRGIILFPEGTRSTTGEIAPFKKGVGLLLAGKPWPAIPAYITGSRDVLPKGATRPRLRRLRVRIGEPASYADVADDREGWKSVAADLEARVRALSPP